MPHPFPGKLAGNQIPPYLVSTCRHKPEGRVLIKPHPPHVLLYLNGHSGTVEAEREQTPAPL